MHCGSTPLPAVAPEPAPLQDVLSHLRSFILETGIFPKLFLLVGSSTQPVIAFLRVICRSDPFRRTRAFPLGSYGSVLNARNEAIARKL